MFLKGFFEIRIIFGVTAHFVTRRQNRFAAGSRERTIDDWLTLALWLPRSFVLDVFSSLDVYFSEFTTRKPGDRFNQFSSNIFILSAQLSSVLFRLSRCTNVSIMKSVT